jgi:tetratricopeptide (TPR) repeat protein
MMKNLIANKESKQILLTFLKNKKDIILPVIIVFCLPVLLYLQTLSFGFTCFDDNDIIINNITFLSDFRNAPQAFLKNAIMGEGDHLYRPLQTLSYMADIYLSGGNNTWMYHLTNILLLGLIACLLFLLFRKFLIPLKLALLSTLVYCAHPLFISSIAWIPARGDLLLSFFSLLSFLFFIEHLQKKKVVYLFLNWLTFTIALFCKETAVTLPFLFIIYYVAFSPEKRSDSYRNEKKYFLIIVLYAISGVLWFWLRSIAIGNSSIQNEVTLVPLISNLQMIPESLATFFLSFDIDLFPSFSLFKTLIGLGIIIMIIVLFFNNKERTKKEKVFCLSWFLFLLLPTMLYKIRFIDYLNHRFFLPLIGILLFVLFIIPKKWFEKKNIKSSWLMVAIFVLLSSITFVKSRSFSDPMTFFNAAISQNPDNALMYNNRGYVKVDIGDFQEAINDYTKAIELNPNFALFYYNRGNAYSDKRDLENAIKDYDKVIELNPDNADAYNNRGIAYKDKGDFEKAIKDYDKVIELNPDDADAYNNRGSAYNEKGDHELAIKAYDKAIELNPNYTVAYYNRGIAYKAKGMLKEAEQNFKKYDKLMKKK